MARHSGEIKGAAAVAARDLWAESRDASTSPGDFHLCQLNVPSVSLRPIKQNQVQSCLSTGTEELQGCALLIASEYSFDAFCQMAGSKVLLSSVVSFSLDAVNALELNALPVSEQPLAGQWHLVSAMCVQPRENNKNSPCEDVAIFDDAFGIFGVFDGVGSWTRDGLPAWKYPCALSLSVLSAALRNYSAPCDPAHFGVSVHSWLVEAHSLVKASRAWGSATCAIGGLDTNTGNLGIAAMGDARILVLRKFGSENGSASIECKNTQNKKCDSMFKVIYYSPIRRWYDGSPFQLSHLPAPDMWKNFLASGQNRLVKKLRHVRPDPPYKALCETIQTQHNDLVITMSDGVTGHLTSAEIAEVCTALVIPASEDRANAQIIANVIVEEAQRRAVASQKFDDMSVVASWVSRIT